MADYKESTISGTSWQRAVRVIVNNTYQGTPSVMFQEELVTNINGVVTIQPVAEVSCVFDPAATFPAIDPVTGEPVGRDITHGEVYALLNSLYMYLAQQRDVKATEVYVEPEPQPSSGEVI